MRRQCELLGINRSGVYFTPKPVKQEKIGFEEELMREIDRLHTDLPCSGSRKLAAMLRRSGYRVGRKLVRRLMLTMGLRTVYPKPNLSKRDAGSMIAPYLLRNMDIALPNQVWSIDITYIRMGRGHMYLTAIIDWFSRKLMGWNLSDTLDTSNILRVVRETTEKHGVPAIINSDQGSQFTSKEFKELLKKMGIRQSMDGKSRWADNVRIERWFRSLKTELIYINEFDSPLALRRAIAAYVDQYNEVRLHEALDYRTPNSVHSSYFSRIQCSA